MCVSGKALNKRRHLLVVAGSELDGHQSADVSACVCVCWLTKREQHATIWSRSLVVGWHESAGLASGASGQLGRANGADQFVCHVYGTASSSSSRCSSGGGAGRAAHLLASASDRRWRAPVGAQQKRRAKRHARPPEPLEPSSSGLFSRAARPACSPN